MTFAGRNLMRVLTALSVGLAPQQRPIFRSTSDEVVVDVVVFEGRRPVQDLAAKDFIVEDNGIRQTVEILSSASIGIDVSLVFDTSGSVKDPRRLWNDVETIINLARPVDRFGLITFGGPVRELAPLGQPPLAWSPPAVEGLWDTPALDALLLSMMQPGDPGRRHIVVQFTDGVDRPSYSRPEQVVAVANRCDALVNIVLGTFRDLRDGPKPKPSPVLTEVAQLTGGRVLESRGFPGAFKEILASLQQAYVLAYRPQAVPQQGWHTINVRLVRPGSFTIRARRGYFAN
jgi:hypothetical protein